ncbi:MAG: tetratricopeptide repeat protein, partial [Armatimonadota bacterium]|nr:tetratricopeptide repeat protein [Armatimonadota bacterium]
GDGSWVLSTADSVVEKVGPETEQTIRYPIFISAYTGQAWQCEVAAVDKELNIALLKLPVKGLPAAPLAQASEFGKVPMATAGQVMSGEPCGIKWPTSIYGITREQKGDTYVLSVGEWQADKAVITEIGNWKWLFLSDLKPNTPIPSGSMVARGSSVVGIFLNKISIGSGAQRMSFGRCSISAQIARYLSEHGVDTTVLYDPPSATVKKEENANDAFQLRAAIYTQIAAGRPAAALEKAQALVKLRPGEADAHLLLGIALAGAGKLEEALKTFGDAEKIDPELPMLRTNKALVLVGLKKPSEAEAELLKAAEKAPNDVRVIAALADFYLGDEKTYEKARTYARKAEAMAPNSPGIKLLAARAEKRLKNYQAAVDLIKQALKMAPSWPEAYYALGSTLEESGAKAEAESAYRKLVELQPRDPNAFVVLSSFLIDQGKYDEARELISKARELNPPQPIQDAIKALEESLAKKESGKSEVDGEK